jgi:hypothetical protein
MGSYLGDNNPQVPPLALSFAKHVLRTNAIVLTFNYDLVVEEALRMALWNPNFPPASDLDTRLARHPIAGDDLPDEVIRYSRSHWNPALGYGFRFGDVSLDQGGNVRYVSGKRFYGIEGHDLYKNPVLKLHGSVNWANVRYEDGSDAVLLDDSIWYRRPGGSTVSPFKTVVSYKPTLITPVLYKRYDQPPFDTIWSMAREVLSACSEVVVIGYSFPPTDFAIRRLLLEAFQDHQLSMLAVVNPCEPEARRVGDILKARVHHDGSVTIYESLDSLLNQ